MHVLAAHIDGGHIVRGVDEIVAWRLDVDVALAGGDALNGVPLGRAQLLELLRSVCVCPDCTAKARHSLGTQLV